MTKQYINSQQSGPSHSSICPVKIQGAQGAQKATEAFSLNVKNPGISASPLIENSNMLKEISCKPTLTSDEPSAAMQCFLKVVGLKLTVCMLLFVFL